MLKQNCIPRKLVVTDGTLTPNIKPGMLVTIILKKDRRTGVLTEEMVKDILTSAPKHYRRIKVRLQDGQAGRLPKILEDATEANMALQSGMSVKR